MKYKRGYYDVFVQTCARYPSNVAVRHFNNGAYKTYTYSELYGVCEYIAQNLQQLQCNRGTIGLVTERNILIPCVIAASHKFCTSFMFVDPSQDVENLSNEMKFSAIITILDQNSLITLDLNKKPNKTITVFNLTISFYNCDLLTNKKSLRNVLEHSFIAMTSGSTGDPKRIQVPVHCIQPNIDDLTNMFRITQNDIIYFSTPLTFDPSMVEILLACLNGASLLIGPDNAEVLFPENSDNAVTVWQTTPSKFFQHSSFNIRNKILSANSKLKILALGGEPLNGIKRLKDLKDWNNATRIFTLYGVTEMSCWACAAELDLEKTTSDREIPLGNCLSETEVVVEPTTKKDNSNTGRIILVSKTRKCIVLNKSSHGEEVNSLKFVDTGDLAEVKNGTIYYRGRKDDVVKRFGHKINLQNIEHIVMQCPRIKACSCIWLPKPRLVVVYFSSETFSSQELSDFLKCKLDDKHWPDKILRVDNMPTNSHGKVSKALLSKIYDRTPQGPISLDSLKVRLLQELKALLSTSFTFDAIKDKDFFSLGGTSFLAVTMCNKISVTYPKFGKFLLPHLLSDRNTMGKIMELAEVEVCKDEPVKAKRKMKRSTSQTGNQVEVRKKKSVATMNEPVEFVLLWTHDTGKCVDASPTLLQTVFNLYVTVGSHSGKIVVVDALSGSVQGILELKARVEAAVYCYQEDPLTPCGVVGAYDGTIVCFNLETCEQKWKTNIAAMIKSKATSCNGFLYIASYDGCIRCIDMKTGIVKQSITIADQAISADLVLAKGEYIVTGTLSGVCASVHAPSNTVAWRGSLGSPVFASPALYDGQKYVVFAEVSGEIHCRTVEKGIKIWKYSSVKGNIFSSIHIGEIDKMKWQMVFGCHDNQVYSVMVKNFQPSLHWKTELTSPIYATPCGLNDKLLLAASNNGKLCVIEADKGTIITEYQLPAQTFSSPAVFSDYLFIGCRNDHLFALRYVLTE